MSKAKREEENKKRGFWKKTLLTVFIVLFVVATANAFQTPLYLIKYPTTVITNCTDSDARNFFTAGTVSAVALNGSLTTFNDACVSPTRLREYYCAGPLGSLGRNVSLARNVSVTCQCSAGACTRIGEAGGVPPTYLHQLVISMENRTLTIDRVPRNLTLLRLLGANNTLRLENGHQDYFLFIAVNAREAASSSYVGSVIYYNYTRNQWMALPLSKIDSNYNNILNTTSSRPGMGITYITSNLTNARTSSAKILVSGANDLFGFNGNVQVIDGYNATALNSTLGQGGTWNIPFTQNGLGLGDRLSASYLYYDSTTGPQNTCYGAHCTQNNPPISYSAPVSVSYISPAGVMLQSFNRTHIKLSEFTNASTRFQFSCTDSDPTNNPYIPGSLSLANPQDLSSTYTFINYDQCTPGNSTMPAINAQIIQSVDCNSLTHLPQFSNIVGICATPRCNSARTACAS